VRVRVHARVVVACMRVFVFLVQRVSGRAAAGEPMVTEGCGGKDAELCNFAVVNCGEGREYHPSLLHPVEGSLLRELSMELPSVPWNKVG
jgi:hypothetical protein